MTLSSEAVACQAHSLQRLSKARRRSSPVENIYLKVNLLLLPLVVMTFALSSPSIELSDWSNRVLPIYLIGVLSWAAYRLARVVPAAIWSPAFWCLVSSAVFFGFGPLVEVYGSYATRTLLSTRNLAITSTELFNANMLSFVSIFCLTSGFWLHTNLRARAWRAALQGGRPRQRVAVKPQTLAIAFIVGGIIFVHGLLMPSQWGELDIVVPGVLTSISPIADVGFALAAYLAVRGSTRMWWVLVLLWPLHFGLSLLSFAKTPIMFALILPALGAYLGNRKIIGLAAAALVCVGVYTVAQDFVIHGRTEIAKSTGTIWAADHRERALISINYFSSDRDKANGSTLKEDEDWSWMRLNYSNVQAIGMRLREDGIFIDSLSNVWTLFVPRLIWPDKPIYIGPGVAFYTLLTGNTGTSLGMSVIGDVYWQFGWAGTLVIMPTIGWMFAMMSWRSIDAVQHQDFIRMPIVLLSILISASGPTNFLVNGIIAPIPIYIVFTLLIQIIEHFLRKRPKSRRTLPHHSGRAH